MTGQLMIAWSAADRRQRRCWPRGVDEGARQIPLPDKHLLLVQRVDTMDFSFFNRLCGPHADMRIPQRAVVVSPRSVIIFRRNWKNIDGVDAICQGGGEALILPGPFVGSTVQDWRKAQQCGLLGHVRQGGGNSGLAEVVQDHAARDGIGVASCAVMSPSISIIGFSSSAMASTCM